MTASSSAETAKQIKTLLKPSLDDRADAARLDELRKIFARLIQNGELTTMTTTMTSSSNLNDDDGGGGSSSQSSVCQKWNDFLRKHHKRFVHQLCERIALGKRTAVRTMWGVVATWPQKSQTSNNINNSNNEKYYEHLSGDLLRQWVRAMTAVPVMDKSIRTMLQTEFIHPNRDVQYYTMIAIAHTANELYQEQEKKSGGSSSSTSSTNTTKKRKDSQVAVSVEDRAERLVEMLMMIPIPSSQMELDEKGGALFSPPEGAVPDQQEEEESEDEDDDDDDSSASDNPSDDDDSDNDESSVTESPRKRAKLVEPPKQRFAFQKINSHHSVWAKAWLAVLRLALPISALKHALRFLPEHVLPHVHHPLRFADFFMQAYNNTGVVPLLALDGLFLLVTHHGLEYPNFYKQLYSLVTPSLLYVKYRTRFFRLIDKCLSRNEMLPAHVVAAFCKRLIRCTQSAPPSSTLFVLALCSNLLRKHPEVSCLIHRGGKEELEDGFDAETDDPEQANALQSSLWELGALERHYYPAVATLAKSIGREDELATPLYNTDEFLVHTYQSFFEQERKRKKKAAALTFVKPSSLFGEQKDVFSDILATSEE